jgi:hypothetical protein
MRKLSEMKKNYELWKHAYGIHTSEKKYRPLYDQTQQDIRLLMNMINKEITAKKLIQYEITAWVHPKRNGNDMIENLIVTAPTKNIVKVVVENWLSKRSSILDYHMIAQNAEIIYVFGIDDIPIYIKMLEILKSGKPYIRYKNRTKFIRER